MEHNKNGDISKCPFQSGTQKKTAGGGTSNRDWWPNELKLNILRQNGAKSNPLGEDFDYSKAFNSVNYNELKQDIINLMNDTEKKNDYLIKGYEWAKNLDVNIIKDKWIDLFNN